MSYRLASLHLATDFDRPVEPLAVRDVAARGDTSALVILDGATRGTRRLSRLVRQQSLLGLRVNRPADDVRVTVTLLIDDLSTQMWRSAHLPEDATLPHEHRLHRLVRLSVQGRLRAGILLDRRPSDGPLAMQRFSLVVPADDLGDMGLVTLSLDLPDDVPLWLRRGLLPDGLTGVCIGRVTVEPLGGGRVRPSLSTGRTPEKRRHLVPRTPGGFVVNPGSEAGPVVLRVLPRVKARRPRPTDRRTAVREPLARARDLVVRLAWARQLRPVQVEVVPLDGTAPLMEKVRADANGGYHAVLEHHLLPAFVRVCPANPPSDRNPRLDWYAWVDGADA